MTRHNLSKLNGGSQNRMAHTYDSKHREIFNDIEQGRIGKIVADLAASYAEHGEIHVVDFGAGTGNLTKFFLEKKFLVTACDVSRMSLDILKQKMGSDRLNTTLFAGENLPFADHTFHMAVTYSVLHHVPDYLRAVNELVRVLKQGPALYRPRVHRQPLEA